MKRIPAIILFVITILLACNIAVNAAPNVYEDFEYYLESDRATITKYIGDGNNVTIPDTIDGCKVVRVDGAFYENETIESVVIPDGVSIGTWTFYNCLNLKNIVFEGAVDSIGYGAFEGCSSLADIQLPSTINRIEQNLFMNCTSLKSISVPDGITVIDVNAFNNCVSLEKIELPGTLQTISASAFNNCTSLSSIELPEGLKNIGVRAFAYSGIQDITIPQGIWNFGDRVFLGCESLKSICFNNSMNSIPTSTFNGCCQLEHVVMPTGLRVIESGAFYNCELLNEIDLTGVTVIQNNAFDNTGIFYSDENWDNNVLYYDNCLLYAKPLLNGEYRIKEETRLIAQNAFKSCDNLSTLYFPYSIKNGRINVCTDSIPIEHTEIFCYYLGSREECFHHITRPNSAYGRDLIHALKVIVLGDISGDEKIGTKDLKIIKLVLAGLYNMTSEEEKHADVNGDGLIDIKDYVALKRHLTFN